MTPDERQQIITSILASLTTLGITDETEIKSLVAAALADKELGVLVHLDKLCI
jgi:hypothetical protein